jgi:hypothetical protein
VLTTTTVSLFRNGDRHAGDAIAGLPGVRRGRPPAERAGVRRPVLRGARGHAAAHRPVLLLWPRVRSACAGERRAVRLHEAGGRRPTEMLVDASASAAGQASRSRGGDQGAGCAAVTWTVIDCVFQVSCSSLLQFCRLVVWCW